MCLYIADFKLICGGHDLAGPPMSKTLYKYMGTCLNVAIIFDKMTLKNVRRKPFCECFQVSFRW